VRTAPSSGGNSPGGRSANDNPQSGNQRGSGNASGTRSQDSSGPGSPWGSGQNSPATQTAYATFHSDLIEALARSLDENWEIYAGRVGPRKSDRRTWQDASNSTFEMHHGRRIAQFMLDRPGENVPTWWGPSLVEVQVLLAPNEGILFVSSNSKRGNEALGKTFPDVDRFGVHVRNALMRRVDAKFDGGVVPKGRSSAINNDPIARRAVKVLKMLSEQAWTLLIVPNPDDRHAEQAIEQYQKAHYPDMERTGPASGTRPPCLGCVIYMSRPEVDALKYYLMVERPIQTGDFYTKATSGARSQYVSHRVPTVPPDQLSEEAYNRLLGGTVEDLVRIREYIEVVNVAHDMRRIPRSPGGVTTPEINDELNRGRSASVQSRPTWKRNQH
jgi:hypothetical protein